MKPYDLIHSKDNFEIWSADLNVSSDCLNRYLDKLTSDERNRAFKYRFEKDRRRFVVSRALLREILASILNKNPQSIEFRCGKNGKPELVGGSADKINFSVSHSEDLALFSIAKNKRIGIDLEFVRFVPDFMEIAERFFAQQEIEAVQSVREEARIEAFFSCWTKKEALVKAIGAGVTNFHKFELSAPFHSFQILPAETNILDERCGWKIKALSPRQGYLSAVAVEL